jgi:cytochrome c oxidase assembly protein subunit 15
VLLACATFPLLCWGGVVTVTGSGMAFSDWLTSDGVFMPLYPWLASAGDKFIEHGHRLLGMLAGFLAIALVVACWRSEPRRWVRRFSIVLLAGVILQGVLGGLRVKIDARSPETARVIALVHGCTGPLFFAATVAMAVVTSRRWASTAARTDDASPKLLRLALLTALLAYLQLVVGAVVRHAPLLSSDSAAAIFRAAVYFHLLLAAAVTVHVLMLAHKCFWRRVCRSTAVVLAGLVVVQLALGASTWVVKYGMPTWATAIIGETGHFNTAESAASTAIATAHGAVGALVVALCVAAALRAGRQVNLQPASARPVAAPLAGVVA